MSLRRNVPHALVVIALLAAFAGLLAAVYGAGEDSGRAEVTVTLEAERRAKADALADLHLQAAAAASASDARLTAELQTQKEPHDRIAADLRKALDASDLRARRLSGDLARLHDAAAVGGLPAPGDAGPPEGAAGAAEEAAPSVADLIETCSENYGIANRNAARQAESVRWYEDLRARQSTPE